MLVQDLIKMTERNWAVVSCYLPLLGEEKAQEFAARWQSAMKVTELPARNRFLFDILKGACDALDAPIKTFVYDALFQAEQSFPIFRFALDPGFASQMEGETHARTRVYAADMLVLSLIYAQLDAAEQKVRALPPQICRTKFNLLVRELDEGAEKDPVLTLKRIQKEVLPMLETLRGKASQLYALNAAKKKTAQPIFHLPKMWGVLGSEF